MSWMHTYSGGKFHPAAPFKSDINIEDIAHALSNICRFGGHCSRFYSVAEHSLLVAKVIKDGGGSHLEQLWGLMHDATEAYMGDIPTPLKATLQGFHEREDALMRFIVEKLHMPAHGEDSLLPGVVKRADRIALVTEARQLTRGTADWGPDYHHVKSHSTVLAATPPSSAKLAREFREKFERLMTLVEDDQIRQMTRRL